MFLRMKNPVNINDERAVRAQKIEDLAGQGIPAYPARVERKETLLEALAKPHDTMVAITGRIIMKRDIGKLTFCQLQDASGKLQIALKADDLGKEVYQLFSKYIDIGDIVAVTGERFQTKAGEESVLVKSWTLLSKSLLPLPDKFHGLADEELRYRKRYLDFLVNPEEKQKILIRGRILRYLREFLFAEGFQEVETPMLETVASGAAAKPFTTHLNAYDMDVYLRICIGELWQKRLLVGGFEKTFEIGRAFRNEGVDHQHSPEFTMLEYYWAYADYEDNMKLHERLLPFVIEKSIGSLAIEHDGEHIDFTPPYPRITFREAVKKHAGIDINDYDSVESLRQIMKKKKLDVEDGAGRGKLLDSLYKQTTRPHIIQPTFVTEYPIELKPLAKKAADPRYTEMFQLIVHGFELSNSYTELNDPIDQRARFEEQATLKAAGDEEAMGGDMDYVEALEHGMPPATGTGIGIDRFAALISGAHSIREVTAFPFVKPAGVGDNMSGKSKKTMVAHAVLLNSSDIPTWSKLNAAAHVAASLAAREGKKLIHIDSTVTTDGYSIPMNIQHAIMMKITENEPALRELKARAEEANLMVTCFTEDMRDSTNDLIVKERQEKKSLEEIRFLGVLVYGEKKKVEGLTKDFSLAS